MKQIYGNHVGIVINNEDPENRGRCQIFIPHLSNTLYKSWNNKLTDMNFSSYAAIPADILARLKETLPWSECAAPIFGGGTGAGTNQNTNVSDTNPDKLISPKTSGAFGTIGLMGL